MRFEHFNQKTPSTMTAIPPDAKRRCTVFSVSSYGKRFNHCNTRDLACPKPEPHWLPDMTGVASPISFSSLTATRRESMPACQPEVLDAECVDLTKIADEDCEKSDSCVDRLEGNGRLTTSDIIDLLHWLNPDPLRIAIVEPGYVDQTTRQKLGSRITKLIVPMNIRGKQHWVLAIVDYQSCVVGCYDPYKSALDFPKEKLLKFLALYDGPSGEWTWAIEVDRPQSDNYNCGVYVIAYAALSMAGLPTCPSAIRPSIWRVALQTYREPEKYPLSNCLDTTGLKPLKALADHVFSRVQAARIALSNDIGAWSGRSSSRVELPQAFLDRVSALERWRMAIDTAVAESSAQDLIKLLRVIALHIENARRELITTSTTQQLDEALAQLRPMLIMSDGEEG